MSLLTSCQNTFQSVVAYEDALDDVETLKLQVHECYSEITKTSNEIISKVKDTYIEKSDLEQLQQDFQTSITQNSSEIRMDFTAITDEIKGNVANNQELESLRENIAKLAISDAADRVVNEIEKELSKAQR